MLTGALAAPDVPRGVVAQLEDWLAIPSVSGDPARASDVLDAAEWLATFVIQAGGSATVVEDGTAPVVIGRVSATAGNAPTVLLYGHFDVVAPGPRELWTSAPFVPSFRDGWLYARGATDDKGNFFMLLAAVAQLAAKRQLPVNVLVIGDGEEEVGGRSVFPHFVDLAREADACVIFDAPARRASAPQLVTRTRGLLVHRLRVRTAESPVHSGYFGGSTLGAGEAVMRLFATAKAVAAELPCDEAAIPELRPAVDLTHVSASTAADDGTAIPAYAEATVSIRLPTGVSVGKLAADLCRAWDRALPRSARVDVEERARIEAARLDDGSAAFGIARAVSAELFGEPAETVALGGSLPVLAELATLGIPTIFTGFDLPHGNAHGPDERLSLSQLQSGLAMARALLEGLAVLPPRPATAGA